MFHYNIYFGKADFHRFQFNMSLMAPYFHSSPAPPRPDTPVYISRETHAKYFYFTFYSGFSAPPRRAPFILAHFYILQMTTE